MDNAPPPHRPHQAKPKKTTYLTLTFGEGDNIQFCQRRLRDLWDNADRGKAPMNWTVSPLLADIGPKLLNHFQRTSTKNDLLVCGPSGAGYTYPDSWAEGELDVYTRLSGRYMKATGMDVVYAYSTRGDDGWQALPARVIESFAEHTDLRGIIQTDEKGDIVKPDAAVPLIGNFSPVGKAAEYKEKLLDYIEADTGLDLSEQDEERCPRHVRAGPLVDPRQRLDARVQRQPQERVPGRVELDLVDPLAVAVVRPQDGRMLVREPAPLERLAAERRPEGGDVSLPRRTALPAQRLDEHRVLLVEVVARERRRLIRG